MKKNVMGIKTLALPFIMLPLVFSCASTPAEAKENTPAESAEVQFAEKLSDALEHGSAEDALNLFEKYDEKITQQSDMQALKASILLSSGNDAEAEKIAKNLLQQEPKNLDVLELNVMIAKKKGDKTTKSTLIRQILAIDPKNVNANIELGDEQSLKHNYRSARDYYRKAMDVESNNADAVFGFGKMSYYLEKDDDAKKSFEKLLAINPNDSQAYAYLGKLESESRNYREAKKYIDKAISIDSDKTDYYFDLGTYCRYMGDYKGAEQAWKKACDLENDYFLGYAYLAGLYDEQNLIPLALENYRKVVEKNPKYYYAFEALGILAWHEQQFGEAAAAFSKARQVNPDNVSYALMTAACLIKEKKTVDAKKYLESVMKGMDRNSLDYAMVRLFHDMGGDGGVTVKVQNESNRTKRGKMLYYLALYYDILKKDSLAQKFYTEVANMQTPMFFEYRLAEWSIKNESN